MPRPPLNFASKIAMAMAAVAALASAQTAVQPFAVVSVKPCSEGGLPPDAKSGGGERSASPGTLRLDCTTVMDLVKSAYVLFANGHVNPASRLSVEGGPSWTHSERYQIDAKTNGPQSPGMMRGPMLQALLEDRFKLRIRRETREVPAYALTVAKGGPKLHPFQDGTCTPVDLKIFEQFPPPPFPKLPPGQTYCGGTDPDGTRWVIATARTKGPDVTVEARALSIDDFIKHSLGHFLDRPVLNRTGIAGRSGLSEGIYARRARVHCSRGRAIGTRGPISSLLPSSNKLGLKLEPAKGLGEFLVIEHVEKPSSN